MWSLVEKCASVQWRRAMILPIPAPGPGTSSLNRRRGNKREVREVLKLLSWINIPLIHGERICWKWLFLVDICGSERPSSTYQKWLCLSFPQQTDSPKVIVHQSLSLFPSILSLSHSHLSFSDLQQHSNINISLFLIFPRYWHEISKIVHPLPKKHCANACPIKLEDQS